MLTLPDYNALLSHSINTIDSFATITGIAIPAHAEHAEYVIHENMFEDYLDIFRGMNTRGNPHIRPEVPPDWYYDHPFFNADGTSILVNKPCIKYILIGEACPEFGANYFYNLHELGNPGYLRAAYNSEYNGVGPAIPWTPLHNPINKLNKLLDLASRGVLLIDLFPVALTYNPAIRHDLNTAGITDYFFNDIHNLFSLTNRINNIDIHGLCCEDFNDRTNSVFVAPTLISYHLATNVNAIVPTVTFPLIFTFGENSLRLMPPHFFLNPPHNYFYSMIPAGTTVGGFPLPLGEGGFHTIMAPRYICCGYYGAQFVPHALFITNALL